MKIFNTVITVCALVFLVEAKSKHECETKHGITDSDWKEMNDDTQHISDKFACFIKCGLEEGGALDGEGNLNIDKYKVILKAYVNLTEAQTAGLSKCLKTTAPVKTCDDIKPIYFCVARSGGN